MTENSGNQNNNNNSGNPNNAGNRNHSPNRNQHHNRPRHHHNNRNDNRDNRNNQGGNRDNRPQGQGNRDPRDNNRDNRDNRDFRGNNNRNNNNNNNNRNFNNNRPNNNPNNNNRKHQYSKNEFIQMLHKKYDTLNDQRIATRKKYFENYYRVDDYRLKKLEQQFYNAIENLRRFEKSLKPWQYEILRKKIPRYKMDLAYSENHQLPATPEPVTNVVIEDPHISLAQKNRPSYKDDTEESVGTMEDFQKLKAV
ncbi:MAG: hypothetical protein U0T83_11190 [Bacteriovoracaceae bacterium]